MTHTKSRPVFMGKDSIYETADLCWWLPKSESPPEGWFDNRGHACNGMLLDYLDGWVLPLQPGPEQLLILEEITNEHFSADCAVKDLDYGVLEEHREAYVNFLTSRGLEAGDLKMLKQAVYPLAATRANLLVLGVDSLDLPLGAALLVLGTNCD